jgi:DNA-binding PadR family transcriptional regulator
MTETQNSLPDTDIAILGLLAEKPSYGYEMEQRITSRGMRNWTNIEQSSIYNSLHRLERNGLVDSEKKEVDGRLRRIYQLTDDGSQMLHKEIYRLLSDPPRAISSFDLGLGNIFALPKETAIGALSKYLEGQKKGVNFLSGYAKRMRTMGMIVAAWLFERPMLEIQARIAWLEKAIQELKTLRFPKESGNSPKEEKR